LWTKINMKRLFSTHIG
jgi:heme a synthase